MKNVTATFTVMANEAQARGESMWAVPTYKLVELVNHLRALDRLFIAAESFSACVQTMPAGAYWSEDEAEGLEYLRNAVKAVAS